MHIQSNISLYLFYGEKRRITSSANPLYELYSSSHISFFLWSIVYINISHLQKKLILIATSEVPFATCPVED